MVKGVYHSGKNVICRHRLLRHYPVGEKGIEQKTQHVAHKHHFNHFPEAVAILRHKIKQHRRNINKPHEIGHDEIFTKWNDIINGRVDYIAGNYCSLQQGKKKEIYCCINKHENYGMIFEILFNTVQIYSHSLSSDELSQKALYSQGK